MKYVILHASGMSDGPYQELGGKTPLQAASTPNMDRLAQEGELGLVTVPFDGPVVGSDVTGVSILGYDPRKYYPGPAPLEAASLGVTVGEHDVVFRCTMVTLRAEATPGGRSTTADIKKFGPHVILDDATAGYIETGQARELIDAVNEQLGSETIQFYPGIGHRHLMVWVGGKARSTCVDPRRAVGRPIGESLPTGDGADILRKLMEAALIILRDHPVNDERREAGLKPANCLWLWGPGRPHAWPSLTERFRVSGAVVAASDLHRGIGICAGLEAVEPVVSRETDGPALTALGEAALRELARKDLLYVHSAIPDEVLYGGDPKAKLRVIEEFDKHVVGTVLSGLSQWGPYRVLLVSDRAVTGSEKIVAPPALYAFAEGPTPKAASGSRRFSETDAQSRDAPPREATRLIAKLFPRG